MLGHRETKQKANSWEETTKTLTLLAVFFHKGNLRILKFYFVQGKVVGWYRNE